MREYFVFFLLNFSHCACRYVSDLDVWVSAGTPINQPKLGMLLTSLAHSPIKSTKIAFVPVFHLLNDFETYKQWSCSCYRSSILLIKKKKHENKQTNRNPHNIIPFHIPCTVRTWRFARAAKHAAFVTSTRCTTT